MARKKKILSPTYTDLIVPVYKALIELGGSGTNSEICDKVIEMMNLSDEIVDESHLGNTNQTELEYQLAWARTYLKNYGVIQRSSRSVWSLMPDYSDGSKTLVAKEVVAFTANKKTQTKNNQGDDETAQNNADQLPEDDAEIPDENKPWRTKLADVLMNMDPYGFERLSKRVLRECGFTQVEVTKKAQTEE